MMSCSYFPRDLYSKGKDKGVTLPAVDMKVDVGITTREDGSVEVLITYPTDIKPCDCDNRVVCTRDDRSGASSDFHLALSDVLDYLPNYTRVEVVGNNVTIIFPSNGITIAQLFTLVIPAFYKYVYYCRATKEKYDGQLMV